MKDFKTKSLDDIQAEINQLEIEKYQYEILIDRLERNMADVKESLEKLISDKYREKRRVINAIEQCELIRKQHLKDAACNARNNF